jgi:hypothetical protein
MSKASLYRGSARTVLVGVGAVVASALLAGTAWASSYGPINAKNDSGQVVATGRDKVYYNPQSNPTQQSIFRDTRNDGNSAYMVANFQSYNQICPPRLPACYYGWQKASIRRTPSATVRVLALSRST